MRPRLRALQIFIGIRFEAGGPTHSSLAATRRARSDKAPRAVSPCHSPETTQTDRTGMRPHMRRFKSSSESGSRAGGPTHSSLAQRARSRGDKAPRAVSPCHSPRQPDRPSRYEAAPARFKSSSNPVRGPEARLIPAWRNAPGPEVIKAPRAVSPCHSPRQPDRPSWYEAAPAALQISIGIRFEGRRPDSFQPGATRQVQE